jgi:Domain of unknown function (DUF4279)
VPDQHDDKWNCASFGIYGDSLEPDEITELLRLVPTRSGRKGEVRKSPREDVKLPPRKSSFWLFTSPLPDHIPLQGHLLWIIEQLEPKREVLGRLAKEYKVQFVCGFSSENGQGGCTFDSALLTRLSSFGIPLVLDLYPPGSIATETDQA